MGNTQVNQAHRASNIVQYYVVLCYIFPVHINSVSYHRDSGVEGDDERSGRPPIESSRNLLLRRTRDHFSSRHTHDLASELWLKKI
jgi:hypothetical protein